MRSTPLDTDGRSSDGGPLRKAFTLLEALAGASRPLSLAELADGVDLPRSSVHRTVRILADLGLAERTEDRGYTVGHHVERLARAQSRVVADGVAARLAPFLLDLVQQTGQVASVAALAGTTVTRSAVLHDHGHTGVARAAQQPCAVHASAPGKLFLAAVAGPAPRSTHGLDDELELVRRTGLAYARIGATLVEVAAPIHLGRPAPVAALALAGSVEQLDLRRAGTLLLAATAAIEEAPDLRASGPDRRIG